MSTAYILISNSVVKRFPYGSVFLYQIIQIMLDHRCQTGPVYVDPEYSFIGKDLRQFPAYTFGHAITDAGISQFITEERSHRIRTQLKRISVIVNCEKISEPSCYNKRDQSEFR